MRDRPALPADAQRVLDLARRDRAAALRQMATLSLEAQLTLVCEAPVGQRASLLDLAPNPEQLIPRLPAAEFCFTVKAMGLESASWLLELALPEQIASALDLDAWRGHAVRSAHLGAWLDALATTDDEALLAALGGIDSELLVHYLKGRIAVFQKPDDDAGWDPPDGAQTLDGHFHFVALREGDDLSAILRILHVLFRNDYWSYFRMLQGVIHELDSENEEWALRWRNARLQDLGFPVWEEAMRLYTHLPPAQRARIPPDEGSLDVTGWQLPVWMPRLPEGRDAQHLIFRTLAELSPEERRAAFHAFIAVANKVAVADQMELSDAETTPRAIEKAARWISRGLEHVATENGLGADEVVRRVSLERLFRVGANLEPEAARPVVQDNPAS